VRATPTVYQDEVVNKTAEFKSKIRAAVNSKLKVDECRIAITSAEERHEKYAKHAVASLAAPMTDQQLQQTFMEQSSPVLGSTHAGRLSQQLWEIQDARDVSTVVLV